MDLNRLKITDEHRAHGGNKIIAIVLCIVCLIIGFLAGKFITLGKATADVKTVVVRKASKGMTGSFTSGGWVEVAKPAYPLVMCARTSERLDRVFVHEGEVVIPGQLVAKLYDGNMKSKLKLAEAKMSAAKTHLDLLTKGYRIEDIHIAEANVENSTEILRIAKAHYERNKKSAASLSAKSVDASLAIFKQAEAKNKVALSELQKLKAGYRPEEIAIAKAEHEEAQAGVELARYMLDYCYIRAPKNGPDLKVLEIERKVGEWIEHEKKSTILSLYDPKNLHVRVDVTQSNLKNIVMGGKANISTEAYPGVKYSATIIRVEPLAEIAKNTITVVVKIDEPDHMLFPEMIAQVTFLKDEGASDVRIQGYTVPIECLKGGSNGFSVFIVQNGKAKLVPVKILSKDSTKAEVEGVKAGQRVITGNIDELVDGQPVEEI
jgi:RND family efflux transporter MFP subunit